MIIINSKEEFNETIKKDKVLVDFYADWCGPCKMLSEILDEIDNEEKDFEIAKINTDNFLSIAKEYKVLSLPALKVFSKGKIVKELQGFMTKEELLNKLRG